MLWRTSPYQFPDLPEPEKHGWKRVSSERLDILWFEKEFLPQDLLEILSDVDIELEDDNDSETISSEDDSYSSEEDSSDSDTNEEC